MSNEFKESFNRFLNEELNKPQYEAVTQHTGSLLVIAGAGSGKTRVITARIAHLILNHGVDPSSIVALTFTNKAAQEMKHRISSFLGHSQRLPFVGTFHSYCLQILRMNRHLLDFPDFTILDSDDQQELIKGIIKRYALQKQVTPYSLTYQLSSIKNRAYTQIVDDKELFPNQRIKEIFLAYEAEKNATHCYDFDDLIIKVLDLFKKNHSFKEQYHQRVAHVLVDEYQDTSHTQHELLKSMGLDHYKKCALASLCAVGDEDQSIYSWRGATVTNMLKLKTDFAPLQIIKIEQNYRSVTPILEAANHVIKNNEMRNPKTLWSDKKATNRILRLACRSGEQEAESIARFIKCLPEGQALNDVAILYRTHFQSRTIEEALIYHSIPYRIVGGIRFYERKEIKDILAYLRLMVNPFDKISLTRIINTPARGLGKRFEEQLLSTWLQNPFFDFKQLLNHMLYDEQTDLPAGKKATVSSFISLFGAMGNSEKPSSIVHYILEEIEYFSYLKASFDPKEADQKIENVKELVQSIIEFEQRTGTIASHLNPDDPFYAESTRPTLERFLHEVTLLQEKHDDQFADQVQMMTLHAAKGLEFHTVIITGLEEELLPSSQSLATSSELEEERRLFYVGITRAQEYLVLTHASCRNRFGTFVDQAPSRFLDEIKGNLVHTLALEQITSGYMTSLFQSWLGIKKQISPNILTASMFAKNIHKTTSLPKTPFKPLSSASSGGTPSGWRKNDQVKHKAFGNGIVIEVQKASGDDFYITALFKIGKKKILSTFLEKV